MAGEPEVEASGPGLELLAEPTRRMIVALLAERPRRPTSLRETIGVSQATLGFHLAILRRAGIVRDSRVVRDGRVRLYMLHPRLARAVMAWLAASGLQDEDAAARPVTAPRWPRLVVEVEVGSQRFALLTDAVSRVILDATVMRVPTSAPGVIGIAEIDGRIVPVLDLATHLGLTSHPAGDRASFMVIDVRDHAIALRVDSATAGGRLGAADVLPMPAGTLSGDSRGVVGLVRLGGRLTVAIDPAVLLS